MTSDHAKSVDKCVAHPRLQTTAERYVWLNLKSNLNDDTLKQSDVKTTLDVNRTTGIVDVTVDAPIGTSLLSRVVGYHGPDNIVVSAGADAGTGPVWAILALDISRSMDATLAGKVAATPEESRMAIVKDAAKDFVEEILSETDSDTPSPSVSIGIVPWANSVGFNVLSPTTTRSAIDTKDVQAMYDTFDRIAGQLRPLRRTY